MGPIFVECVPRPGHVARSSLIASLGIALALALAPAPTPVSQIAPTMQESPAVPHSALRGPHRCGARKHLAR